MTSIADVVVWEALDSRGTPTVACEIRLASGATGSTTRSERTAKRNRLLRIEAWGDTVFAGRAALAPIGG